MKKIIIALTASMLLYGCGPNVEPMHDRIHHAEPRLEFDRVAFENMRAAWEAQGITCYVFESRFAGLPRPFFQKTVTGGEVADIELAQDWRWASDTRRYADFNLAGRVGTVSSLFDWIEREYEEQIARFERLRPNVVVEIRVTYNAEYFFPEKVESIERCQCTGRLSVGGGLLEIRNFQPIR